MFIWVLFLQGTSSGDSRGNSKDLTKAVSVGWRMRESCVQDVPFLEGICLKLPRYIMIIIYNDDVLGIHIIIEYQV